MAQVLLRGSIPITASAAAALLFTILTQQFSPRQAELGSDILCWIALPILFLVANRSPVGYRSPLNSSISSSRSSFSSWVVAVGVAIAAFYKAEMGTLCLIPALTPILLIAERKLQSREWQAPRPAPLIETIWALAAWFAIFILSDGNLVGAVLSAIPVAALLLVYAAFVPRMPTQDSVFRSLVPEIDDLEEAIVPLSVRVVLALSIAFGIQTVIFGFSLGPSIASTLALGWMKALAWYFTIRTSRYASWSTATAISTLSLVSTLDPFMQSTDFQALSQVAVSFLTLGQVIYMLPKQAKARSTLWVFALVSLVPYMTNIFAIRSAESSAPPWSASSSGSEPHPVAALIHSAQHDFDDMLKRQSQNYTAAVQEYQSRYGIAPPPGFDTWYEFAVASQSPIIDDFDTIFDTISPFLRLSGREVSNIISALQTTRNIELWHCSFVGSGDNTNTQCVHPYRSFDRHISTLFDKMLADLHGKDLPGVRFLVNHFDEPRVVVPPPSDTDLHFTVTDLRKHPTWDAVTQFCFVSRQSNRTISWPKHADIRTFDLPFVRDRVADMDLCQHPDYRTMNGLLVNPTSFNLISGLAPVFSTGAPLTMGDILIPSPAYSEREFTYDEAHDTPWDKKSNQLYWAGSTTGGYAASDSKWRLFHRQRFVQIAQNRRSSNYYLRSNSEGVISRVTSSFLNGRLWDVAFTRIFQCDRPACREQRGYFHLKSWANKDRALASRLVFDIDGNGISGRYYKLLASRSVPLKQTLLREWHDDRLLPWVHYVPVSQSMEELPELVFYLTSTEEGRELAREVAEAGRNWFGVAMREVDRSIYLYRLLLEMARLQDVEREAGSG
ncbi:hypothetical protein B0H66DRAFT_581699 [Apodospora peruviana]|uniref:Glycosyl transferase CAP10 domain-containing protein n=1 Tax=Apodospora peruviana TaxID=516989 RepID=A0AAE0IDA2_9PEZI|nr:hypothetical protein B0H66DRAFT_581699 [Apodospora peruviana]